MKHPQLIVIDGPMGAGKTTVAKLLHKKLISSAHIGHDRTKFFVSGFDRTPKENAIAGAVVLAMCSTYLKHGVSVILEQGHKRGELMRPYLRLAKRMKVLVHVFQIEAKPETLLRRLAERPTPSEAKSKVSKKRMIENIDSYYENKYPHAIVISSENLSPTQVTGRIFKLIR